ncbi:helix-turn-helix domain-containing protein [Sphingobium sp. C100]|uniref:helix-turn-helix domain-containing protein n=1 Tax=Sphingobium sp. C100 TaxID=1207055 RepID=UPI00190F58CD
MLLACDRRENSSDSVFAVAISLGYKSESSFNTAFKRVMDCSPRQYGRWRKVRSETSSVAAGVPPDRLRPNADNGSRCIERAVAVAAAEADLVEAKGLHPPPTTRTARTRRYC